MSKSKVETLKTILAMVFADGKVTENETRLMEFLIDSYGLTPAEEAEVRQQKDAQLDFENLAQVVTEEAERCRAYETAFLVSLIDGSPQPAESEMLVALRQALEIKDKDRTALEDRAREIYKRFAASHS